jgi:hypothetical protein
MTEDEAKSALLCVQKGVEVVVIKGRKVKHGTRGIVRWEGEGDYGLKVGIAVSGQKKLIYTALQNVEAVVPGLERGEAPNGGWLNFWKLTQLSLPQKGHRVRHQMTGEEGKVFWVKGMRLGFTNKQATTGEGAVWCNADEVLRIRPSGLTAYSPPDPKAEAPLLDLYPHAPTVAVINDESGSMPASSPSGFTDLTLKEEEAHDEALTLQQLPHPFNTIATLQWGASQSAPVKAYDHEGNFLMELPVSSAHMVQAAIATGGPMTPMVEFVEADG